MAAITITIGPSGAAADSEIGTATEFLQTYDKGDPTVRVMTLNYLKAMQVGMLIGQVAVEKYAYCLPDGLALTGEQLLDIVRRAVEKDRSNGTVPVGMLMLGELEQIFPASSYDFPAAQRCGQSVDRRDLFAVLHHEQEEHEPLSVN